LRQTTRRRELVPRLASNAPALHGAARGRPRSIGPAKTPNRLRPPSTVAVPLSSVPGLRAPTALGNPACLAHRTASAGCHRSLHELAAVVVFSTNRAAAPECRCLQATALA